ncbi:related to cation diffusion facilitator family metal ion transporter [Cephalotrichum gorgonifer]|uniref:Related to cation diffusion facilitator family metal ion transporter n=1 Tax=Cephalotrichum gorgonifer TaxID=2041049 RepID=A0AAE8MRY2_9PEZI|nr:related to cation diffusion facilitator family metal ion transporter [Cephalotrichum gorgonifer]
MGLQMFKLSKKQKLIVTIGISFSFFLAELIFGFRTGSLALVADAFHYLNDLIGFCVALAAVLISERSTTPQALSFGWQRGQLLGGFFNGVFLLALGVSIFLQSIERFVEVRPVEDPMTVLILGGVGLFLNVISLFFLHDHGHGHSHGYSHEDSHEHNHGHDDEKSQENDKPVDPDTTSSSTPAIRHHEHRHAGLSLAAPGHDLGMMGVIVHVIGDAINNIGVMVAAIAIWKAKSEARFYADPAVSLFIAIMIFGSALPLVKSSGSILLQTTPAGVNLDDIKHDLEKVPGIESVHELHVWRLNEQKAIASVHVVVSDDSVPTFIETGKHINECLHAYGIHSATLQPELSIHNRESREPRSPDDSQPLLLPQTTATSSSSLDIRSADASGETRMRVASHGAQIIKNECQLICAKVCEGLMCCKVNQGPVN